VKAFSTLRPYGLLPNSLTTNDHGASVTYQSAGTCGLVCSGVGLGGVESMGGKAVDGDSVVSTGNSRMDRLNWFGKSGVRITERLDI
jgi:hypothetical protein